mgnify:CR=1 FL=1
MPRIRGIEHIGRILQASALPVHEVQNVHELLASMVQAEVEYRDHARTQKYLKASRLRYNALPEEIICNPERGITREQVLFNAY